MRFHMPFNVADECPLLQFITQPPVRDSATASKVAKFKTTKGKIEEVNEVVSNIPDDKQSLFRSRQAHLFVHRQVATKVRNLARKLCETFPLFQGLDLNKEEMLCVAFLSFLPYHLPTIVSARSPQR